jgi:hypothetical protein
MIDPTIPLSAHSDADFIEAVKRLAKRVTKSGTPEELIKEWESFNNRNVQHFIVDVNIENAKRWRTLARDFKIDDIIN